MSYLKYRATKCTLDGITFASKREMNRYSELKLLEKAKLIEDLVLQPKFTLQPSFKKNGVKHRSITYIADFMYWDNKLNKTIIEDVKGFKTDVYKIKKKLFEYQYPEYDLKEV